jgi:hypothetical protein
MYKLIYKFNFNLDDITKNNKIKHPEFLVYRVNNII